MTGGGVVYVTYDGLLEPLGASQVTPYVEGLADLGFDMTVLSFEKPADAADRDRVARVAARLERAGVAWLRRTYHARPSLPATAWDVAAGARALRWYARGSQAKGSSGNGAVRGAALLHARSYVAGAMGLLARSTLGARLLFDMRGFWVDERLESGRWLPGTPAVLLARRVERDLLVGSDHLVHLSRNGRARAADLLPGRDLPAGTVIPTCVDLESFQPVSDPVSLRAELGLPPGFVAVHAGTLSGWYLGPETVRLGGALARRTGGTFLVLTREVELANALLRAEGVEGVVRTVAPDEVPRWLAACDVGLALVRTGFAKTASVPTKVGEYLACGLAVVGTDVGDLVEQFAGSAVALTVDARDDLTEVAGCLVEAARRPDRSREARALAVRHYSLADGIQRYADIYRSLGVEPCG